MTNIRSIGMAILCLFSIGALANTSEKDIPTLIKKLVEGGVELQKVFEINDKLTGYSMLEGTSGMILIGVNGTDLIMNGDLLDSEGKDITKVFREEYLVIPEPDYVAALEKLEKETVYFESPVKSSKKKNSIWVLHDPNCGYCKKAWNYLHVNRWNDYTVNWVPVAALGQSSLEHSALLLNSNSPGADMGDMMKGMRPSKKQIVDAQPHYDQVRINTSIGMDLFNAKGTPVIIVKKDEEVKVIYGFNEAKLKEIMRE